MSISETGISSGYGLEYRSEPQNVDNKPVAATHSQVLSNVSQNIAAQSVANAANNKIKEVRNEGGICLDSLYAYLDVKISKLAYSVYEGREDTLNECIPLLKFFTEDTRTSIVHDMIEAIDCTLYRAIDENRSRTIRAYGAVLKLLPREEQVSIITTRTQNYADYLRKAYVRPNDRVLRDYLPLLDCMPQEQAINLMHSILKQ